MSAGVPSPSAPRSALAFAADWPLMALLSLALCGVLFAGARDRQRSLAETRRLEAKLSESARASSVRFDGMYRILAAFVELVPQDPDAAFIVKKYGIQVSPPTNPAPAIVPVPI